MSFLTTLFAEKESGEKTSRPLLDKILETLREGAFVVGEDTRILASNQAAYQAFGRRNGQLENKRLSEVVRDLSLHEAFRKALQNNEISDINLEIPGIEKQKYEVHIAPLQLGGITGAIGIFYDITQIKHLESVRQEFFSNISHELRTPLTSILAFVETLEDGAIDDQENNQHFLRVIRKNAERMRHLIDDTLELSTIESGKINFQPKNIEPSAHIAEIFTNLSTKAAERGIELINEIPADVRVFADVVRFEQMFTNLIDNAIKFNVKGGSVIVSHISGEKSDTMMVADTGEGISSEHLQRIFERFYRTDRARSREIGGTGLGLAIVKHLARLHGGEVAVKSVLSKGTVFFVELPKKT